MNQPSYVLTKHPILVWAGVVWVIWLVFMITGDRWGLFAENWFMSVTMVLGSFIAGATSEGGGAVAFPVMTLLFDIKPHVARDFSLMIQSVGMTAATFTIICLRIQVVWRAILISGFGGMIGMVIGMELIAPMLKPAYTKVFFTSFWFSFALALVMINRVRGGKVFEDLPIRHFRADCLLLLAGIVGGCVSGLTGSGLDITTFALLVLGFRVSETVATPTSVVLMASNSVFGFFWKSSWGSGMAAPAWDYWYVCIPVVVLGAPAGAWFIRNRPRQFVINFLFVSISIQYLSVFFLIPQSIELVAVNLFSLGLSLFFFFKVVAIGKHFTPDDPLPD